jgi:hypothetical protein
LTSNALINETFKPRIDNKYSFSIFSFSLGWLVLAVEAGRAVSTGLIGFDETAGISVTEAGKAGYNPFELDPA